MGITDQLNKLKENWLILAIALVLILVVSGGTNFLGGAVNRVAYSMQSDGLYATKEMAAGSYIPSPSQDFAPSVEERIITKTASMSNEVKRGNFYESESKLKSIIKSSGSYILNENVNNYGKGIDTYRQGSYNIKVDTEKYDAIIQQLKEIGEVTSFNENARDITGDYTNTKIEIEAEQAKLKRYQSMYDEAAQVSDKLTLTDRIFDQERKIKYMEDSLRNMDQRVDYSTIYLTMTEKKSAYANVLFVKFSEIVSSLVNSLNNLIKIIVVLLPWAIAFLIIRFIVNWIRNR
ncbi:MAG: DUF4349 domain-containing protein [Nanoarchaeota archaeon]|nr:DUF4349 domain-containing protein [Nanoarchaeota archaeon]MBU1945836.1 DUF4349 domain-containing protein [Nanoarchaeota archaeon]